jgi:hypothetical protein
MDLLLRRCTSGMLWGEMLTREGGNLIAVSTNRHGTPAAAVGARIVIKEKAAPWIGAEPQPCPGTLGDQLRRGAGYRGQQPIEAALARYEFDSPGAIIAKQLIVSFGDAQDIVEGFDPFAGNLLFAVHGREDLAEGGAELPGFQEQSFGGLRIGLRQSQELGATFS